MTKLCDLPLLLSCSDETARVLGLTRMQLYRLSHVEGLYTCIGSRRFLKRDALLRHLGLTEVNMNG